MARQTKITKFARGKECTFRIPGVCNWNPETSVWCHDNSVAASQSGAWKPRDWQGAIGCSDCHAVYDRNMRKPPPGMNYEDVVQCFQDAKTRSQIMLEDAGLIKVSY